MTANEINQSKDHVVIFPLAAIEQHGPELETGTDLCINQLLQNRLLESQFNHGKYLLLETCPYGASEHHLSFGGTLSLKPKLFATMVIGFLEGLIKQGFKRILIFNSHGGNRSAIHLALEELTESAFEKNILLGAMSYWDCCKDSWEKNIPELNSTQVLHACEIEGSIMMYHRGLKKLSPSKSVYNKELSFPIQKALPFASFSEAGSTGHPELASLEKGEKILSIATQCIKKSLETFYLTPLPKDIRT